MCYAVDRTVISAACRDCPPRRCGYACLLAAVDVLECIVTDRGIGIIDGLTTFTVF